MEAPGLTEPIWKAAGILLFGLFAALSGAWLAALALCASAAGDFFLDMTPPLWVAGMAAFGVAHVFYLAAFGARIRRQGVRAGMRPLAAIVLAGSLALYLWLLPGMGELKVPGTAYHAVLTMMVGAAILAPAPRLAMFGALAFLASDLLIALGLYKGMGPFHLANWVVYAAAQALLAWGLTMGDRAR